MGLLEHEPATKRARSRSESTTDIVVMVLMDLSLPCKRGREMSPLNPTCVLEHYHEPAMIDAA